MSEKEQARIEFHKRRELETNEHDFAFLDGFDAGAVHSADRVAEIIQAVERYISGHSDKMCRRDECPTWAALKKALADGPRSEG